MTIKEISKLKEKLEKTNLKISQVKEMSEYLERSINKEIQESERTYKELKDKKIKDCEKRLEILKSEIPDFKKKFITNTRNSSDLNKN